MTITVKYIPEFFYHILSNAKPTMKTPPFSGETLASGPEKAGGTHMPTFGEGVKRKTARSEIDLRRQPRKTGIPGIPGVLH
ncbi:hypothetical protein [Rhizobium cremeum]|uniref:hypothetical protein n=1 Tax=Rhizobium cremeum TaxID=2813827 RepID=UPI0039E0EF59